MMYYLLCAWVTIIKNKHGHIFYNKYIGEAYPVIEVRQSGGLIEFKLATKKHNYNPKIPNLGKNFFWELSEIRVATKKEKKEAMDRMVAEKV